MVEMGTQRKRNLSPKSKLNDNRRKFKKSGNRREINFLGGNRVEYATCITDLGGQTLLSPLAVKLPDVQVLRDK